MCSPFFSSAAARGGVRVASRVVKCICAPAAPSSTGRQQALKHESRVTLHVTAKGGRRTRTPRALPHSTPQQRGVEQQMQEGGRSGGRLRHHEWDRASRSEYVGGMCVSVGVVP